MAFNKKSTLAEILKEPGAEKILNKFGLPCLFCPFRQIEAETLQIGSICHAYGINTEKLIKELNKNYGQKQRKSRKRA